MKIAPRNLAGFLPAVTGVLMLAAARADAGYKDDIGWTALAAALGSTLPSGSNVIVTQVEYHFPEYMPDTNDVEFAGKTFTNVTLSSTGVSGHANDVGKLLYGTNTSIAPDITAIRNYDVPSWYGASFLHAYDTAYPPAEQARVINLSVINQNDGAATNGIRKLDYVIDRDRVTVVAALGNDSGSAIPQLFGHSYNAIVVGRSDGIHSSGPTTFDAAGRVKPDIVTPLSAGSYATPVVGAAAAMLIEECDRSPSLSDGTRPQCVKAILLAGATKEECPSWDRTPLRPLDEHYGAGELNIRNSHRILTAGKQTPATNAGLPSAGWDYRMLNAGSNVQYFFTIPASNIMARFSAVLAWNRMITDPPGGGFDPQPSVANLDMMLRAATNFVPAGVIDSSTSLVDNVEHIYRTNLCAGQYMLEVTGNAATNYAIAWHGRISLLPRIGAIDMTSGGIRFSASVSSDVPYAVEAATNLLDAAGWKLVSTNTSASNVLVFIDADGTNYAARFYRLVPDP